VTSNCWWCSEHASSALYTSNPFTDRAEAAYLSPLFVKPSVDGNRFRLVSMLQFLSHLVPSSLINNRCVSFLFLIFFYLKASLVICLSKSLRSELYCSI
jgi:hypothetical protein